MTIRRYSPPTVLEDKIVGMVAPICVMGGIGWYYEIPYSMLATGLLVGGCMTMASFVTWIKIEAFKTMNL
jgi:hypothetical protein